MNKKKLIIFIPSIEGGGVEKNLFLLSNYLAKNINETKIITSSFKYKKRFIQKITKKIILINLEIKIS